MKGFCRKLCRLTKWSLNGESVFLDMTTRIRSRLRITPAFSLGELAAARKRSSLRRLRWRVIGDALQRTLRHSCRRCNVANKLR
jgi:hypothetical protein